MANFFNLEFDTTPPVLTVTLPTLVSKDDIFDMTIKADEKLDGSFQDIKFVTPDGSESKITFDYNAGANTFTGKVDSSLTTSNVFYINTMLRDDVYNVVKRIFTVNIAEEIMMRIVKFESKVEVGNTIRYTVLFADIEDNPIDPDIVQFKIYDDLCNELFTYDMEQDKDKDGVNIIGQYIFDYTPANIGSYFVEAIGILNSKPVLHRERLEVRFDGI